MPFRFRRSIKILPGVRLNLSRSGVSTSVGIRGAHITVGHGKVRETVGLPGTGVSYTHVEGTHQKPHQETPSESPTSYAIPEGSAARGWLWIVLVFALIGLAVYLASPR